MLQDEAVKGWAWGRGLRAGVFQVCHCVIYAAWGLGFRFRVKGKMYICTHGGG